MHWVSTEFKYPLDEDELLSLLITEQVLQLILKLHRPCSGLVLANQDRKLEMLPVPCGPLMYAEAFLGVPISISLSGGQLRPMGV
jgi:hypothetical protein